MSPRVLVSLLILLLIAGCRSDFSTEGDTLRAQVMNLENENRQLARRVAELEAELTRESARPGSLPEEIRSAQPHVAELSIGSLSHVADTDDDGRADLLRLYVKPLDGRGRIVQMVGTLHVNAALLPAAAPARTVGTRTVRPGELRDAYRSGITGTHYTIEVPVDLPARPDAESELTVRVVYDDGLTGGQITAQEPVKLR